MKKASWIFVVLVLVLALGTVWLNRAPVPKESAVSWPTGAEAPLGVSAPSSTPVVETSAVPAPAPHAMQGSGAPSARTNAAPLAAPLAAGAQARVLAPTADQVREEAGRDPEAPSRVMLRFSISLEHKMERALSSPQEADAFFPELDHCANNDGKVQLAETARVLCLSNADRLVAKYPELRGRYENLESRMDGRVLSLKKLMDSK